MKIQNESSVNKTHIGFFGKTNTGKSTLINTLCGQEISIVSEQKGTTTDVVAKNIEFHNIGACVLYDTAGFDDVSELGQQRINATNKILDKIHIGFILFCDDNIDLELKYYNLMKEKNITVICCISKSDIVQNIDILLEKIKKFTSEKPLIFSKNDKNLKEKFIDILKKNIKLENNKLLNGLVVKGDLVMLVMPQDKEAPKNRLILPQSQTIKELLDKKCITICTTDKNFINSLNLLKIPPKLIITDSQCFDVVYKNKPTTSLITSFSVLFAKLKGDIKYFIKSTKILSKLDKNSKILIAEACSHVPIEEDIGRVQIPNLIRKKISKLIKIDIVSGNDFPTNLENYDLIIHCGGCMFSKKHVMNRVDVAKQQKIPMTNYGIVIAYFNGILNKIIY